MEARLKKTFICADVQEFSINADLAQSHVPKVGDVAIFEVVSLGKHLNIQGETGLLNKIMPGDRIMGAFGNRYATEQFEGYVPKQCQHDFHILGAGGTIGWVHSTHAKFSGNGPTRLRIIGYAVNGQNQLINTRQMRADKMIPFSGWSAAQTKVVLSVGSSMDSGKTTTAAYLVHGLVRQGKRVVFIKLTGTAYTKDCDLSYDLGACQSLDFSQFGFPSTYMCDQPDLLNLYESLLHQALKTKPDYVILEIADGILQRETKILLQNPSFMKTVHNVVFRPATVSPPCLGCNRSGNGVLRRLPCVASLQPAPC